MHVTSFFCSSSAAGQHTRYSVLDKVVPGYYYRRMESGDICMSTCCNNTASEHAMCERLVIDDIVHWAKDYMVTASLTFPYCLQIVQIACIGAAKFKYIDEHRSVYICINCKSHQNNWFWVASAKH